MKGNRGIGYKGGLPWHLPADLARFRRLTMGHSLIMGRKTYESLGGRNLPGRKMIVLTRRGWEPSPEADIEAAGSIEQALRLASEVFQDSEAFIAGGAEVYRRALELSVVDRMYLSLVSAQVEVDTFFPDYDERDWEVKQEDHHPADERNPHPITFQVLDRRR